MRRKDREVKDFDKLVEIVDACEIIRLGLADGNFPYIVPLNFAYTAENGEFIFYVHGAMGGRKYELMKQNPYCSFEMDVPIELDLIEEKGDVTMRYMSVIGTASITFLEGDEKEKAMDEIFMARSEMTRNYKYNKSALSHTAMMKLTAIDIVGKVNPVRK